MTLQALYDHYLAAGHASSPHLPTLREYASRCDVCVEFGVKHGASAVAMLLGTKGKVYGFDIKETPRAIELFKSEPRFFYVTLDSRTADVPQCDLLFLDSMHNYEHVKAELEAHAHKVGKYLIFHDTITFGSVGAVDETGKPVPGVLGIRPAIDELMMRDRTWFIERHDYHSHGLLVLERR